MALINTKRHLCKLLAKHGCEVEAGWTDNVLNWNDHFSAVIALN